MKKKILSALLASAMVLSLAACGSTPASTGGSDAASGGDAAPASGGEVVVYSPNSDTEVNAVIPAFEEATGIKVILQSMGTGDVLARLEAEKANPQADVNWGAVNLAFYTEHPNSFVPYDKRRCAQATDPALDRLRVGRHHGRQIPRFLADQFGRYPDRCGGEYCERNGRLH